MGGQACEFCLEVFNPTVIFQLLCCTQVSKQPKDLEIDTHTHTHTHTHVWPYVYLSGTFIVRQLGGFWHFSRCF